MSFCWRSVILRMSVTPVRHCDSLTPKLKLPGRNILLSYARPLMASSFGKHSITPLTSLSQTQIHQNGFYFYYPSGVCAINKPCLQAFHLPSKLESLSETDPDGDHIYKRHKKKKMGSLKTSSKRTDWLKSEELIETRIFSKGEGMWTHEDWVQLSQSLSELDTGSWENMCIIYFYNKFYLALGQSLMEYLLSRDEEPSPLFVTYLIGLLGKTSDGDAKQEEKMKEYYDELLSKMDVLDSLTMEVLTKGLCYTRYYRECVTLMTQAKEMNNLSTQIHYNTFIGGLKNKDHELCTYVLSHFDDASTSALFIQQFHQIVDEALKCGNEDGLRLFFCFLEKQGLTPKKDRVRSLMESLERYEAGQWQGIFGDVHHITGKCSICRHAMEEESISDEEFKSIQSSFLDQVIVSENIFFKTSPEEVKSFISFVEKKGPFDVVIDGLNVLFVNSSRRRQKTPDPFMLSVIESYFSQQGLKVLILGSKFLRSVLKKITHNSDVYTCSSTQVDDVFFLYAALHSGKNTLIVSADKLRDHKSRLEPKLRPVFHRWLKSAQVIDFYVHSKTDNMILKRRKFKLGPVEDTTGWHLPFDDVTEALPFGRNGVLCLRHGPQNFASIKRPNNFRNINSQDRQLRNYAKRNYVQPKNPQNNSVPWYKL